MLSRFYAILPIQFPTERGAQKPMINFDTLKQSYISTIQIGIAGNADYNSIKNGNDICHKFCEIVVDNSGCPEPDKKKMKDELELLKESLSQEIDRNYRLK